MIPLFSKLTNGEMTIFLSCLFGAEFAAEREACRACGGTNRAGRYGECTCAICHGLGTVRVTVECPKCFGLGQQGTLLRTKGDHPCGKCSGTGRILAPIIDPRWLSSTVLDLAGQVRRENGKWEVIADDDGEMYRVRWSIPDEQGRYQWVRHYPENLRHAAQREADEFNSGERFPRFAGALPESKSRPEAMPILRDALMDAGCNNEEILRHCESMVHLPQCWVPEAILGGK